MITTLDVAIPAQLDAGARARSGADGRRDGAAALGGLAAGERRASAARRRRAASSSPASRSSLIAVTMVRRGTTPARARSRSTISAGSIDVVILLGDDRRDRARAWTTTIATGIDDGRVARADPARVVGHDAARRGARPHDRLPRHRADVDLGLRARRHQSPQRAVRRGRAQVFPARRVLDGVPALRHRARVRRDGRDRTRR